MEAQQGEEDMDIELEANEMDLKADEDEYSDAILEELEEIKKRMKELEEEATNLLTNPQTNSAKKVQTPVASEAISPQEVDSCSVFVGNVDYSCMTDAVQCHFQSCGTMNRVTILTNKFGEPKGHAYVKFLEDEAVVAVQNALLFDQSELCNRQSNYKIVVIMVRNG